MRKIALGFIICLVLTSCLFGDNPYVQKPLIKNYWLYWLDYKKNQQIVYCTTENVYGSIQNIIIPKTVFAVGFNNRFIIAKQHPFIADSLENSLYDGWNKNDRGHYPVKHLKDTVFLKEGDTVYLERGKWYHTENRYSYIPDSLSPYKEITIYHIIDTGKKNGNNPYTHFSFRSESDFKQKCQKLGIGNNLKFSIFEKTLE